MSTKPNRPKATKLHSDFKPLPKPNLSEETSTAHVDGTFNKTTKLSIKTHQKQTNIDKASGIKPNRDGTSTESNEADQSRHRGFPIGFVSRKEAMARVNARESKSKLENGTTKENNEAEQSKLRGFPKGFVSRKEAMARINARESKTKVENDAVKPDSLPKNSPSSRTYMNHGAHKIVKEKDKSIPKTIGVSEVKTEHTTTRRFGKSTKDNIHDPKNTENKTTPRTLEKGITYRVPTRDAYDSIAHIKPDLNVITKGEDQTPKVLTRKQMPMDRDDNQATRRHSASTTGTTTKRISSAKTSLSSRSSVAKGNEYLPSNALKIMIMNASGKNDKSGASAERRKQAIQTVICKESPDILLFQEFRWVGITGKTWGKYPIPEHFTYKGHTEASILYDRNVIEVNDFSATEIDSLLGGLQRNANNRLQKPFPLDFNPVPRMCITQVTLTKSKAINFIIISWHGRHNQNGGGRMKEPKKIEYFEYLMELLRQLKEKYKLPILIAGDFNVDMHSVEKCVQPPFKLCMYDASMRRTVNGIVDFFIVTEEIQTNGIIWFDLERDTKVFHPSEILDHDPVSAIVRVSSVAKGKQKF